MFLVRKGNPKGIKDWSDLVKPGVQVITPNPKTSGGARWNYLAAWEYAQAAERAATTRRRGSSSPRSIKNVPVLDSGARGSTTTFLERGIGDVLLAWENEAYLALAEAKDKVEIVAPSISILAEPSVAVVDKVVDTQRHTRGRARVPRISSIRRKDRRSPRRITIGRAIRRSPRSTPATFAKVKLFTIDEAFGGWETAQKTHFADGGTFDQIYKPGGEVTHRVRMCGPHDRRAAPVLPGFRLTLGFTIFYLCLIVLVPLLTLPARTATMGWNAIWQTISDPRVVASYRLSVGAALVAASVNAVFGLIVAWVLARYRFPGKRIVDAFIDLPFALPTAVAGITLTTLYAPNGWLGAPLEQVRHQGGVHAARHHRRARVHRTAVRRPDAAAGDRGSRRRDRGSGDQPRREPLGTC